MKRPYPSHRHSGVEWLGEVPEHWKVRPTKYASRVIMGQSPSSDTYHDEPGERPFLQGNAEFGERSPTPKWYCDAAPKVVETGTLLLSVRAPVGALNKADQTYGIGRGLCGVAANQEHLDSGFAWWALHVIRRSLEPLSVGSTYEAVSAAEVGGMSLPTPPLTEQRSIAAFLDDETAKIDSLITKKRLLLERLAEYRTALITRTVTKGLPPEAAKQAGLTPNPPLKPSGAEWIGDIPEHWAAQPLRRVLRESLKYGANEAADLDDPDLPRFVRITDIADNRHLRDETFRSLPTHVAAPYLLEDGDLLFARSGATYGQSFLYNASWGPCAYAGYLIRARLDTTLAIPEFVSYFCASHSYASWLQTEVIQATIENVNAERYSRMPLPLPPIGEQQAIISFLDRQARCIDALSARVEVAIERLQEYRTALITAAVTGKIDVREHDAVEMGASRI